jgi:hypothetical protein
LALHGELDGVLQLVMLLGLAAAAVWAATKLGKFLGGLRGKKVEGSAMPPPPPPPPPTQTPPPPPPAQNHDRDEGGES